MDKMYYTHVNRNVIDSNRKHGRNEPPIKVQKGKTGRPTYCHSVVLPVGARLVYSHEGTLLPCGARLVIMSEEEPEIVSDPV